MVPERRKFIRIPDSRAVSYRVVPETKTNRFLSRDISQGGLKFYTHKFVPRGSIIRMSFDFREKDIYFEALVVVRWVKCCDRNDYFEVGVEFADIPFSVVRHLIEYINARVSGQKQ